MTIPDADTCYRAVRARDPRFDGWFFTAVRTTGIYCRPSCPAVTPSRRNVEFHASAAGAQRAGFRACKRCRPDASPGSPDWDSRGDLAGRALRLIRDGVIDRDGVAGLARRLGYSERQIHRTLVTEIGAGPLALARAQRARTARVLLETSSLPSADVAFAAGFASVRQFNDTIREVFGTTPSMLRSGGGRPSGVVADRLTLRLPYREPMELHRTLAYLGARAVDRVESYDGQTYSRTLRLPSGPAVVELDPVDGFVRCRLRLGHQRDLTAAVARVRRLLDLDADPTAIESVLGADRQLAPLVAARPGLRSPGAVDGFELAVRAVVGQQVSVSGARRVLSRIVGDLGERAFPDEPWLLFPSPEQVVRRPDEHRLPIPAARQRTLVAVANAIAVHGLQLDPGADRDATRSALLALPGVGPWTADYVRMRALGDPDVLLSTDLGVRKAAAGLGVSLADGGRFAPWGSYASHHLWASLHATPDDRRIR